MAYRSRKEERRTEAASEGLVVDMVQQFADKYAFVRELVQNGIDAGGTQLSMRARYLGGEGVFSLGDDGEGMTRDIIEGPLLTLFNSAKDEDDTKIGKYGVGFVSVFAIDPDEVLVETWRQEGSWSLSLLPDHSYELAHGDPRQGSGTVVSVRKRMSRDDFREHADGVLAALRHWCKHARIPIHWHVDEEGGEPRSVRIDEPLSVDAVVAIDVRLEDMHIVLGVGTGFEGFYNHGLTLWETERTPFGIAYKVDSPALSHTLSRDNVRHDDAYDTARRRVRELIAGALRSKVIEEMFGAAEAGGGDYEALLVAACIEALAIGSGQLTLPLCNRVQDSMVGPANRLAVDELALYEPEPTQLTAALAKRGRPVLRADWEVATLEALATKIGAAIHPASTVYALLTPLRNAKAHDQQLEEAVAGMLRVARVNVDEVRLARASDEPLLMAGVRVASAMAPQLVDRDVRRARFRFGTPPDLMLIATHEVVEAARKLARSNVDAAAHLLARHLIVEAKGEVSKRQSDALISAAARGAS